MIRAPKPTDISASVSWPHALGWRWARQALGAPLPTAEAAAAHLGGVQAQVLSAAGQVLRLRTAAHDVDLADALWTQRSLVRTWAQRGTLHLLPSTDWDRWIAVLSERVERVTPAWERYHGVSADDLEAVTAAVPKVLRGGPPLTREELTAQVVERLGKPSVRDALSSGWGAVLKPAANLGALCQGPPREDGATTYVHPDDSLRGVPRAPAAVEDAVPWLVRVFLSVHGPATLDDFARWFGVRPAQARRLLKGRQPELAAVDVEGATAWVCAEGLDDLVAAAAAEGTWLLPAFDPYVLHPISHRSATIPPADLKRVSRTAGWIAAVVVDRGLVVGTWSSDDGAVTVEPFATAPTDLRGRLHRRREAFAAALGLDPAAEIVVAP